MARSVEAGRILELDSLPTLSDGTAGGVEQGSITFPLVREVVDEHVLVGEDEIAAAMRDTMEAHHMMVEGAAGVAVAGYRRQAARWAGADVAIVLCGANLSLATLRSVLS
jgi:threonine dehydratase